jgi:proline iminopeptidase
LQGGPGGPVFDANIEVLSAFADLGYDVYLYDLVGCGHSERLHNIDEYTVERHQKDLEAIITTIGADKNILIAQSWGAILATNYTADNADKIERIIFTGAAPIFPMRHKLENVKAPDSLHLKYPTTTNKAGKAKAYNLRAKFVEFVALHFGYKLASDAEMDDFATYLNFEMNKSTVVDTTLVELKSGYGYYVNIKTAQNFEMIIDKRKILANLKTPILMLRGQFDSIKWGYTTEYLNIFKNHKLVVISNAGHAITSEQPELYIKAISDFLLGAKTSVFVDKKEILPSKS